MTIPTARHRYLSVRSGRRHLVAGQATRTARDSFYRRRKHPGESSVQAGRSDAWSAQLFCCRARSEIGYRTDTSAGSAAHKRGSLKIKLLSKGEVVLFHLLALWPPHTEHSGGRFRRSKNTKSYGPQMGRLTPECWSTDRDTYLYGSIYNRNGCISEIATTSKTRSCLTALRSPCHSYKQEAAMTRRRKRPKKQHEEHSHIGIRIWDEMEKPIEWYKLLIMLSNHVFIVENALRR